MTGLHKSFSGGQKSGLRQIATVRKMINTVVWKHNADKPQMMNTLLDIDKARWCTASAVRYKNLWEEYSGMSNKKNLLIYAHYYIPDIASTGQICVSWRRVCWISSTSQLWPRGRVHICWCGFCLGQASALCKAASHGQCVFYSVPGQGRLDL